MTPEYTLIVTNRYMNRHLQGRRQQTRKFFYFFFHCLPRLFLCQPLINSFQSLQGSDSWVSVHNLQSQGGGILDPDDRLSDVVDDREQILASFEDGDGAHHHGGGDGASGSSVGTGSPDIFHVSYR
jgi:hypothetical protein